MTRLLLFGLFGGGNSGNDASLAAVLHMLKRIAPDAEVTCICPAPDVVTARHGIRAVPVGGDGRPPPALARLDGVLGGVPRRAHSLIRAIGLARGADALLFPGTGVLDDFGTGPGGMPAAVLGWCLAARLAGCRVGFVDIGAGPIHDSRSRRLFAWAARLADYRSYRDAASRTFVTGIGIDTRRDEVFPDIVFSLPTPAPAARVPCADGPAGVTVGVGVMGYYGWRHDTAAGARLHDDYLGKMRAFVHWLLDQGHRVRLLTGDAGDAAAVAAVAGAVRAQRHDASPDRLRARPQDDLQALMREIAETDLVVATRFHNVVSALKLGRPVLSISYAAKNDVLLDQMGLGAFHQHIETLDLERLKTQFAALLSGRARHAATIKKTVAGFGRRLDDQERSLAAWLMPPPAPARHAPPRSSTRTGVSP